MLDALLDLDLTGVQLPNVRSPACAPQLHQTPFLIGTHTYKMLQSPWTSLNPFPTNQIDSAVANKPNGTRSRNQLTSSWGQGVNVRKQLVGDKRCSDCHLSSALLIFMKSPGENSTEGLMTAILQPFSVLTKVCSIYVRWLDCSSILRSGFFGSSPFS